ncbi:MAG: hypothetical protein ABR991_05185 [Terracidiphilus sp.]|jgi:hypothetical protein
MVKAQTTAPFRKARTKEALEEAIAEAIRLITPENAKAGFKHCFAGLW